VTDGRGDEPGGLVLTTKIKDVVSSTGLWLVVCESVGGAGKVSQKGDRWLMRGFERLERQRVYARATCAIARCDSGVILERLSVQRPFFVSSHQCRTYSGYVGDDGG
jgi:hypothetical protein